MYVENGILIDDRTRGYAVFVVESENEWLGNARVQNQKIAALARGMREVIGEWYVYSLAIGISKEEWLRCFPTFSHSFWEQHIKEAQREVKGVLFERKIYLVVPISPRIRIQLTENGRAFFNELRTTMINAAKRVFNAQSLHLRLMEQFEEERRKWWLRFRSIANVRIATNEEVERWLRHGMYRGLEAPESRFPKVLPKTVSSTGIIHPLHRLGVWTQDGAMKEGLFSLKIIHADHRESHQTFYSVLRVPNNIDEDNAIGFDWLHEVDALPFPVDVATHIRVEDPLEARKNLRKKKLSSEEKWKEYVEGGETPPLELEVDMEHADELEQKLRMRNPLVHAKTIIGIGAKSDEELQMRRKEIIRALTLTELVQAPGDQRRFWQAFYPYGQTAQTAYEIPMDAGVFAAGLPFTALEFGDHKGFYLGKTVNGRAVFFDPRRPAQELNMQPSVLIAGGLGSGKTNTAQYIAAVLASWGAKIYIQDPKGHDYDRFHKVGIRTRYIRLRAGGDQVNPFRLGVEGAERDLLDLILNDDETESDRKDIRASLIGRALVEMKKTEQRDMYRFGDALDGLREKESRLEYRQQLDMLLDRVENLYHSPLGHVLFAPDTGETPQDYDATIVDTSGLTIPPSGKVKTLNEKISIALFFAVTAMGMGYFTNLPQQTLKVMILDEAWKLRKFSQGVDLVDNLLRQSRSLNIVPIMLMQNATDFKEWGESIDGLFAWRFILRMNSQTETAAALQLVGLEQEDSHEWSRIFSDFQAGEGLVVDALGRTQRMRVHVKPSVALKWFDTTPKSEK
ncbi:hypothetical protein BM613_12735 [Sulfoacidibacillus thermotolerans]|uniref:Uncharacterized protein n=1 Tax=Sulfoacidibacillus thermotolerans TaxID=1765684 RepID=A0A2U3D5V3_SULT2|nr:hypothetical protein BM613_12735 [Sulfoacidibacillus thermotolerans]